MPLNCGIFYSQESSHMMKVAFLSSLIALSPIAYAAEFTLSSTDIAAGKPLSLKQVFNGFGCTGDNISPQLAWHGAPKGTQSFAITAYDPDAPSGSGWWHWTVVNIPADVSSLATGASSSPAGLPVGAVQGRNDYGTSGFGGACPPAGDKPHHYQFTVWALKVAHLPVDANAGGALIGYMLRANALAKVQLVAPTARTPG
jgi:Raf kinase inhibitor-like YbhB/YbcL family protein